MKDKIRKSISRIIMNTPCEIPNVYRKSLYVPIYFLMFAFVGEDYY